MPQLVLILNGGNFVKVYQQGKMVAQFEITDGPILPGQVAWLQQATIQQLKEIK